MILELENLAFLILISVVLGSSSGSVSSSSILMHSL